MRPLPLVRCCLAVAGLLAIGSLAAADLQNRPLLVAARRGFTVIADAGLRNVFPGRMAVPEYPYEARRDHWSGSGIYRAFVTPEGKVTKVTVVKGARYRVMDDAVIYAARRWRAKPGRSREVDFSMTFIAPPRAGMPGHD